MLILKPAQRWIFIPAAFLLSIFLVLHFGKFVDANPQPSIIADRVDGETRIFAKGLGTIRRTEQAVTDERRFEFRDSETVVLTWSEISANGGKVPFYAISTDGETVQKIEQASQQIDLKFAKFDPLSGVPATPFELTERGNSGGTFIVQFATQPIEEYRKALRDIGGTIYKYLPEHSYLVRLSAKQKTAAEALPFVRWIGRYEPAYKIDAELIESIQGEQNGKTVGKRLNIMMLERGPEMQNRLADIVVANGGEVHTKTPKGFRMEATLNAEQLRAVLFDENVLYVDEWSAPENDMNIVREFSGANSIESTLGFTGQGVRAEVCDNGLRRTHNAFNSGLSPIIHNSPDTNEGNNHGTSTYGINFGRGDGNSAGRGLLPDAQGIFADYDHLGDRYEHTEELVNSPWNAVYQSNSWGSNRTTEYTSISAEMDDITHIYDLVILNSQSNAGNRDSRPQAWAKNVVSVGGVRHYDTASTSDDRWNSGASIGPASDGRIKPDLAFFYDDVRTTYNSSNNAYTSGFGGTSAATPMTAGYFGIFFQMWHEGIFGNPTGATVFESRPKMATAKAMMINSAAQWSMSGTDISRIVQGWGRANVQNLYDQRNKVFIVNEADSIQNLETKTYQVFVPQAGSDPLKVTLVYTEPPGNVSSGKATVNDITLRVTSPSGTVYWGNHGLGVGGGMWSVSGGSANSVDPVENVFIEHPEAGYWKIDVIGSEINEDSRPESFGIVDADFALVASGIARLSPTSAPVVAKGRVMNEFGAGVSGVVVSITDPNGVIQTYRTGSFGHYEFTGLPAGETYVITARSNRYEFDPPAIVRTLNDDVSGIDFIAKRANASLRK